MWFSLNKILPFNINKLGLNQVVEINEICSRWDNCLAGLFGASYKGKAKPMSLKDKILIVDCLNSVWASELQMKQERIKDDLNGNLKKDAVERIKFIS